jgi:hypothetical protein
LNPKAVLKILFTYVYLYGSMERNSFEGKGDKVDVGSRTECILENCCGYNSRGHHDR